MSRWLISFCRCASTLLSAHFECANLHRDRLRDKRMFLRRSLTVCAVASFWFALGIGVPERAVSANGSVTYTYDALGRIATMGYDTGVLIIYAYDANGNRTSQVVNVNAVSLSWSSAVIPCTSNCWGQALWQP